MSNERVQRWSCRSWRCGEKKSNVIIIISKERPRPTLRRQSIITVLRSRWESILQIEVSLSINETSGSLNHDRLPPLPNTWKSTLTILFACLKQWTIKQKHSISLGAKHWNGNEEFLLSDFGVYVRGVSRGGTQLVYIDDGCHTGLNRVQGTTSWNERSSMLGLSYLSPSSSPSFSPSSSPSSSSFSFPFLPAHLQKWTDKTQLDN